MLCYTWYDYYETYTNSMKAEILLIENSVRYGNTFISRLLNEVNYADSLSGNGVQWFQYYSFKIAFNSFSLSHFIKLAYLGQKKLLNIILCL